MHTLTKTTTDAVQPVFYTVAEAARLLRVDPATIYRAIREDAFPAVRVRSFRDRLRIGVSQATFRTSHGRPRL